MKGPQLLKVAPALEMVDLTSRLKLNSKSNANPIENADFQADLARALELEVGHSPPAKKEREKLASLATTASQLKEVSNFDAKVKKLLKDEVVETSSLAEEIGALRHKIAQGEVSTKVAFAHLKELTQEAQKEKEAWKAEESERQALAKLKEEASSLDEKAVSHIPFLDKINFAGIDSWFNQIWPLNKPDSLLNDHFQIQIPYHPDSSQADTSASQQDTNAWEKQFDADWSRARKASPELQTINFANAEEIRRFNPLSSGSEPLPDSDKIFADLVQRAHLNLEQGNYRMNLELKPDHLGNVSLKLSLVGDKMNARFLVDNENVGALLVSRLQDLKAALAQHGVSPEKLEIAVRNRASQAVESSLARSEFHPLNTLEPSFEPQIVAYFQASDNLQSRAWIV